ncbi:glycosyltransferase family 4 protein [Streptomyces camelliae]|uniref:D-inositol 3-phosphate glycosyltransferase n=1 Tax=Streptomyces camelliae TaxID=3004093 RepID=A0ABY7P5D8_9ACTN|nr:glycosyltransferase family 4 protein [Streptomyces sp. HUAS 2-6]WBO64907.1 glycosyltransferase family 4 protein [Streptomyces sp. HUAS 2-6]
MPFLSEFRRSFYRRLEGDLKERGIQLVIAYGEPYSSDQSARRDVIHTEGALRVRQWSAWVAGRPLVYKSLGSLARTADVLVVDQSLRNMELYPQLMRQWTGRGPAVAMWDHGRTYTRPQSALEQSVKYALTRRARWFFSYTAGGAQAVTAHGFPRQRVTVVQNAIDTKALDEAYRDVTPSQITELRQRYGLTAGRTGLFIGALSATKRISFLVEAAENIAGHLPGFRLLVAGTGEERTAIEAAAARTSVVVPVGQAFGEHKALLGAVSDVMLMPGLVGLCAVDSFVLETPIVTTDWPWHAPEFEYLEHGRNAVVAPDDPRQYAASVAELLGSPERLDAIRQECRKDARQYTVEEMSRRFTDGLVRLLQDRRR